LFSYFTSLGLSFNALFQSLILSLAWPLYFRISSNAALIAINFSGLKDDKKSSSSKFSAISYDNSAISLRRATSSSSKPPELIIALASLLITENDSRFSDSDKYTCNNSIASVLNLFDNSYLALA
jgi:hypothetical protein